MPKGTNSITPALNQKSTSPQTRVIDSSRAGQKGSVQAAPVPVPSQAAAHANRQKPDNNRVPVDLAKHDDISNCALNRCMFF